VTPVRRRDLLVAVVGLAVAAWLLSRTFYGDLPPLHWYLPLPLGVIALAEALGARTLKARLEALRAARSGRDEPTALPRSGAQVRHVEPLLVARVAVLAQASAWVGAVFAGLWAGVLLHVAPQVGRLQYAAGDTVGSGLGVVLAVALVAAALWLESVCRVPPSRDEERTARG
jgi:hypothetical protein